MSAPSILDTHRRAAGDPTPRWEATLRAAYGLELRPVDIENLTHATRRTATGLGSLSGTGRPVRELWCRVGRRGRKSFEAALVGVHEAAWGGHERYLVTGERGLIAIISKDAAGSTLVANFAELHAQKLGFDTNWTSIGSIRVLEIAGVPFGIACFPCSARAPRGYAIPVVIADEIAHWAVEADEYVNSDTAVLGAVKPAMAQFPDAKLIAISSPLGETGLHFDTLEQNLGDDAAPGVLAVEGPTWEWNPEISEVRTHELERDPETHSREFGAKPSGNEGTAFVSNDVAGCFEPHPGAYEWGRPFLVLDPAETTNTFAWCVGAWLTPSRTRMPIMLDAVDPGGGIIREAYPARDEHGNLRYHEIPERPVLRIFRVGGWTGEELRATTMDKVAAELAEIAKSVGANVALSDRRGDVYLAALLSAHRLRLRSFTITNDSKHEGVQLLRMLMRDRQISIIDHAGMRDDLRTFPRKISGGRFRYGEARGTKKHWDHASLLVTLAHALLEERGTATDEQTFRIEGAPTKRTVGRRTMLSPSERSPITR